MRRAPSFEPTRQPRRAARARLRVVVVGGGVFGTAAALELATRGHAVTLLEAATIPARQGASTDISKVIRREYGSDVLYQELAAAAIDGWRGWNETWPEPLYHASGLLVLSTEPLEANDFAGGSWAGLAAAGCRAERMDAAALTRRFPAWRAGAFADGFYHAAAGWADSGRVVARLAVLGAAAGVTVRTGAPVATLLEDDRGVVGIRTAAGEEHRADHTVVAAGVWSARLAGLPWGLAPTAHPVFHLRPADPTPFVAESFPVFMADVAATGWYGFPWHPREQVVKVARHARGRAVAADAPRDPVPGAAAALRTFLADALPGLAAAPLVAERSCFYCDTADGHFWIDRDPARRGLTVASGGSGHGFKFAPLLGPWIADAVEGRPDPRLARFAWRREDRPFAGEEEARAGEVDGGP